LYIVLNGQYNCLVLQSGNNIMNNQDESADAKITSGEAKERILDVSTQIFADKGFAGGRVDEIAQEAGVPKSLIYYHYKSKQGILDAIFNKLFSDFRNEYYRLIHEKVDYSDKNWIRDRIRKTLDFIIVRKNSIQILLAESVSSSDNNKYLLEIMHIVNESEVKERMAEQKITGDYLMLHATKFTLFFQPLCFHAIYREIYAKRMHVSLEKLDKMMIDGFIGTWVNYALQFVETKKPES